MTSVASTTRGKVHDDNTDENDYHHDADNNDDDGDDDDNDPPISDGDLIFLGRGRTRFISIAVQFQT